MTVQVDSIYAVPTEIDDKQAAAHPGRIVHTDPDDAQTTEEQIAARSTTATALPGSRAASRRKLPLARVSASRGTSRASTFRRSFSASIPTTRSPRRCWAMWARTTTAWAAWSRIRAAAARRSRPHVHRHGCAPPRAWAPASTSRSRARIWCSPSTRTFSSWPSGPSTTPWRRPRRTTAPWSCRTCTPGRFWRSPFAPPSIPTFRHTTPALLRNHAVSDVYEPGSVFKLVTYSAALEQHVTTPDDMIDCQGGQITLAGRVIHDDKGDHYGVITVHEALEHSSDVAAVKLALKVGPDASISTFATSASAQRTGAELPGETRGLLRPAKKWGARRSAPSPSARRSPSRRCNWSRWSRPSPTAASICRRTC
jgi:cell division protein FtsI (penicillin-binding protein 3)